MVFNSRVVPVFMLQMTNISSLNIIASGLTKNIVMFTFMRLGTAKSDNKNIWLLAHNGHINGYLLAMVTLMVTCSHWSHYLVTVVQIYSVLYIASPF